MRLSFILAFTTAEKQHREAAQTSYGQSRRFRNRGQNQVARHVAVGKSRAGQKSSAATAPNARGIKAVSRVACIVECNYCLAKIASQCTIFKLGGNRTPRSTCSDRPANNNIIIYVGGCIIGRTRRDRPVGCGGTTAATGC